MMNEEEKKRKEEKRGRVAVLRTLSSLCKSAVLN
jgi:hypothetical protein